MSPQVDLDTWRLRTRSADTCSTSVPCWTELTAVTTLNAEHAELAENQSFFQSDFLCGFCGLCVDRDLTTHPLRNHADRRATSGLAADPHTDNRVVLSGRQIERGPQQFTCRPGERRDARFH